MYNRKQHVWKSGAWAEEILQWAQLPENRDNPEALFVQADVLLGVLAPGQRTTEAVWLMEQAAKGGYPQAALGMGQMFEFGWGVQKNRKQALHWYGQAAALGSQEAHAYLQVLRARKRRNLVLLLLAVLVAAVVLVSVLLFVRFLRTVQVTGVQVSGETEMIQVETVEEFNEALADLIAANDTELVISGQQSTNRLLLVFEGDGLDLSAFPAVTVLANGENYVVIQFDSEEAAAACLETLEQTAGIVFVQEDSYSVVTDGATAQSTAEQTTSGIPYTSPYTGCTYYTWGAEYLGLDRMAAWLQTRQTQAVTVAVVDSGSEPHVETADRMLEGTDVTGIAGSGQIDGTGHGSHVAGTILDCTQGLEVYVLPVRVMNNDGAASDSWLIAGVQYSMEQNVDVMNLSLGGEESGSALDYFLQLAIADGISVVVSAGNEASDTANVCPAHLEGAIVVGACDSTGTVAYFSNYGESVDICAPGVEIYSYTNNGQMATMNGTSMAAPHISALVAMMRLYLTDRTPAQIEKYLTDYCEQQGDSLYYGAGIPWAGYFMEE